MSTLNLDAAKRLDIICRKGDTFKMTLNVTDASGSVVNLNAYTYKMEVRDSDTATGTVIASGSFTISGTASGLLTVTADASATSGTSGGLYVYDLQTTATGTSFVQTWIYGTFKINEDVTV